MLLVQALFESLTTALRFMVTSEDDGRALWVLRMAGVFLSTALFFLFYSTLPTPLGRPFRSRWVRAALIAATLVAIGVFVADPDQRGTAVAWFPDPGVWAAEDPTHGSPLLVATFPIALAALIYGIPAAISAARNARGDVERRQMRMIARAFVLSMALNLGVLGLGLTVFFEDRWTRWDLLLNIVGPSVVGMVLVALLAYGILRAQIFGVDLKIKWTLKQSTLAAIFIGLFFMVSESVAEFFSERTGTYVGIVAAGALLFALAPLQHLAQRVADKAMPGVKGAGEMTSAERIAVYEDAARGAWADGALSADERAMLDRLAGRLGVAAEDARRIESVAATAIVRRRRAPD
jgi:hypothetical protein